MNGDGQLTPEELAAAPRPEDQPPGPPHAGPEDLLARFDGNADGVLTQDELPEQIWQRISSADTDGDGAVSLDELAAYRPTPTPREDLFARFDTDGDGLLTETEVPADVWSRLVAHGTRIPGMAAANPHQLPAPRDRDALEGQAARHPLRDLDRSG
jgi:Ca2+-binding EF-hand superfamily protein